MTVERDEIEDPKSTVNVVCGVLLLLGLPVWVAWGAWVDMKLWAWFVVPLGVPALTWAHAAGLGVLIRSMTAQVRKSVSNVTRLGHAIASPAIYLALGWLIRLAMALAVFGLLAQPAQAREQADGIFGSFSHETSTGSGVVLTDAGNRTPNFTAREEIRYRVGRLQLAVRLDGNAEKAGLDLAEPGTVTTIELFGLASYRVAGPVAACAAYGWTRPSIGVPGPARETWLAGALVGSRERWVLVGAGVRRVVGDDVAAMAAWRVKVDGKASAVGDAVGTVRDGRLVYQVRAGVALSVAGTP